ncbi:GNAT family N-acetyltransferase [Providencia burhodogranariea]|uniref:Acetyltransferase n=1 Tax=Providencia burhodogranariea DSM 19968 TaxID=1141662 RepID=K8WW04_9GAMM|nr:GNAT family N-acetyltransferase [Providencia burhodogranariea]EKT64783.1 acetyltransferase [Providencia burhodogranariea DSM 19968]
MINLIEDSEIEKILKIWLDASIESHHFVDEIFWRDQLDAMRNIYIPSVTTRSFKENSNILGFYCLSGNSMHALFVSPDQQNKGIGSSLLYDAKNHCDNLELTVFKENFSAVRFYKKHGFIKINEKVDPHTKHLELFMRWSKV